MLSLPSPFWKGSDTNFVNKISSSMFIITIRTRHWVKGRVICSPTGIAFGIGKESFIFPGFRGRLYPLCPSYPSSFYILPTSFLPVGCQRKMLRTGWSESSKPSASKESLGSFCQVALNLWLSCALPAWTIRPCLAQQEVAGCSLSSCRRKKRIHPDSGKKLNRNW